MVLVELQHLLRAMVLVVAVVAAVEHLAEEGLCGGGCRTTTSCSGGGDVMVWYGRSASLNWKVAMEVTKITCNGLRPKTTS